MKNACTVVSYRASYQRSVHSEINGAKIVGQVSLWWVFGCISSADPTLGRVKAYVTRFHRLIQLDTANYRVYISPAEPEGFLEAVHPYLDAQGRKSNNSATASRT